MVGYSRGGTVVDLAAKIKRGLKQSKNIIFDSSRIKNMRDDNLRRFLIKKAREKNKSVSLSSLQNAAKSLTSNH